MKGQRHHRYRSRRRKRGRKVGGGIGDDGDLANRHLWVLVVVRIGAAPGPAVSKETVLQRPDRDQRHDDEKCREYRDGVKAEADCHPERSHHPDRGCRRQASDLLALTQDAASAQKAHTGHDRRGDAGGVDASAEGRLQSQRGEQARSRADERHGAHTRRVAVYFPLGAESEPQQEGDDNAKA